jgi:cathepsin L
MKAAVLAFIAVIGSVCSSKIAWNSEFDLVDLARMDVKDTWNSWKLEFGKNYVNVDEEFTKFGVFIESMQKVAKLNSDGFETARFRLNQFSDLTSEEFRNYVHGPKGACYSGQLKSKLPLLNKLESKLVNSNVGANPTSVDWTTKGVVTPVKNQGNCGSCWSFSATGSTECRYAIATGTLNSLSEQQLVDCSKSYGNLGCAGGEMDAAFQYIEATGGLCTESEYPYTASDGTCKSSSCGTYYDPIKTYTDVTKRDESALETATVSGCVSVAIEADQTAFQYYSSGILTGNCGTNLDHGVLVVGYGVSGTQEYWKVKNSWGTSWGEAGYVLICKDCDKNGDQGECGINDDPSYPDA